MKWTVDNENKELRERAARTLAEFQRVEREYERPREKIIEQINGGYRIRYVAVKKGRNKMITTYPTEEAIRVADRYTICLWYRRLAVPETAEQERLMDLIVVRFTELGGFTPEISKSIGW